MEGPGGHPGHEAPPARHLHAGPVHAVERQHAHLLLPGRPTAACRQDAEYIQGPNQRRPRLLESGLRCRLRLDRHQVQKAPNVPGLHHQLSGRLHLLDREHGEGYGRLGRGYDQLRGGSGYHLLHIRI